MGKQDQWIIFILIILILLQCGILIMGSVNHKLANLTGLFNLLAGAVILIYWVQKQLRIDQHYIETREILVLGSALFMTGIAVYSFSTNQWGGWLKIMHYIFFGLNLLALVLFLVFMLCFKMNRLI